MSARASVLIACGGTGGHLFPGIAVAQALRARGVASLLAISQKDVDRTAIEAYPDMEFLTLPARPLPRPWSLAVVPFLLGAGRSLRLCRQAIVSNGVGAVLGMGGFTTMVPVLAARLARLPVFLHDSNAIPGKANRMAARFATTFFLGLDCARDYLPGVQVETVGTPVRDEFLRLPERATARAALGLDPQRKTLLVLGGSQGARALNRAAVDALGSFDPGIVQAMLLTGAGDHDETVAAIKAKGLDDTVIARPFCKDMPAAYAAADVVLARAGASSLSELATVGLPALLVPYPYAADDHQSANAAAYVARGAAELLPQARLSGTSLAAALRAIWGDPDRLAAMAAAMRACAPHPAAATMADRILVFLR